MSTALRHKERSFMHGTNARNCAMINRNVIRLRSKHKRCWVTVIFIVIFTIGMNAKKRTKNQLELIIMYTTKIFEMISMMTLESGVVFAVRLVVERMIMHAVTLQFHIQLQRLIVNCAATTKINVATSKVVGIFIVPAALLRFKIINLNTSSLFAQLLYNTHNVVWEKGTRRDCFPAGTSKGFLELTYTTHISLCRNP